MAEMTIPQPPAGFTLDAPPQQDWSNVPPPPAGFTIDGQEPAKDDRSVLQIAGDAATRLAKNISTLRMSDVVKGVAAGASDAAQLPGDVYSGRVDLTSEEGQDRARNLAGFASPMSAGSAARRVASPALTPLERDAAQSGVSLTAGQRTGSPSLLSREDAAFGGGLGVRAQEVAQAARARQMDELFRARENIGEMAGRGTSALERPADAGGIVADAVKANAAAARQTFKQGYDTAFSSEGAFKPQAFEGMRGRISERLVNRDEPIIIDDVVTPVANRALDRLDQIQNLNLGKIGQPAAGETVVGVNLRGVDQARRQLVTFYKAAKGKPDGGADARAVQGIIREFDDQIEQAVTKGLFEGDEAFLGALKDARAAYASYQKTFKPQGRGDDVGRILDTMVQRDVTPEQVANYIYGSSKVGATGTNVRVVSRLKQLLGEESAEWAAIRQGAWNKVAGISEGATPFGGQKAATRINDFIHGEGRTFARQIFSPDEIAMMQRHANIERATAQKGGTVNNSQSGNRLAGLIRDSFATIGGALGMSTGGPQGAAAGYATGKAMGGIADIRNAAEARALYRGAEPVAIGRRIGEASGAAANRLAVPAAIEVLTSQGKVRENR